jgi:Glycosyl transferase family group 2
VRSYVGAPGRHRQSTRDVESRAGVAELISLAQGTARTAVLPVPGQGGGSAPVSPSAARERHWASRVAVGAALLAATMVVLWAAVTVPAARYVIYAAWMLPLVELAMLAAGHASYRFRFTQAPTGTFTTLIVQITTTGREHTRVSEIIAQIRSYGLTMVYQIWVVTEPGHRVDYPLADRVLVVPAGFRARSQRKARALEFSRQARRYAGLERSDVKILFVDDDVTLTEGYVEAAFAADYDVCEGVVSPRTAYATWPPWHFLTSHADDIRTHSCLVHCSVFQGILRRPLHVHGEGLTMTGEAEGLVTWDWPVIASEDLVFGQRAAEAGLRWGWFHEYAEVTSPWTLRDYLAQRRRWLWGDIHAISHRSVISFPAALLAASKYVIGVGALLCSAAGWYLRLSGQIPATAGILDYAKLSVLAWMAVFFACGWIGASSPHAGRDDDSRLLAGVLAVLVAPISVLLAFAAIIIPLAQGDPRSFMVIRKTRERR